MSNEEALAIIIENYCISHNISHSEFGRKSGVSRAYINKITANKCGKFGVSSTIKELIAKGLNISTSQLEKQIEQCKNGDLKAEVSNNDIISNISNELKKFNSDDLEIIHDILSNSNSERLKIINNLVKNMK